MNVSDLNSLIVYPAMGQPARRKRGNTLHPNNCPGCGKARLSEKKCIASLCNACAGLRRRTHGLTHTKLYWILKGMQHRCNYKGSSNYHRYGGRGIKVCEEWTSDPSSFVRWAKSNGYSPGLQIDRIDNDGHYSPENCRFVTNRANTQNTSRTKLSAEKVPQARDLLKEGLSTRAVAKAIGTTHMAVWHLSTGRSWKNVP